MNKIYLVFVAFTFSLNLSAASFDFESNVSEQLMNINNVYVPPGFSSEADAYVVVSGQYSNSCYQWGRAGIETVSIDGKDIIEVKSYANVTQGMCLMAMVPYNVEVSLGKLKQGKHLVRFIGAGGAYMEKTVTIE